MKEVPMLKYSIGKKNYRKQNESDTVDEGETSFFSAQELLANISRDISEKSNDTKGKINTSEVVEQPKDDGCYGRQLDLTILRTDKLKTALFWNLIYYFNEHGLPFDCVLPYEDSCFEDEYNSYKNHNSKSVVI